MVNLAQNDLQALMVLLLVLQRRREFSVSSLKACLHASMWGRYNAQEIHAHRKYVDEQLLKMEERQKALMAKNDMPHSPISAPMDFPSPPTFYTPWEQIGNSSMMFGAPQVDDDDIEEDLGGHEESIKEEEDVPAGNTPTDEKEEGDDDDDE
jgi:hypothetical protein